MNHNPIVLEQLGRSSERGIRPSGSTGTPTLLVVGGLVFALVEDQPNGKKANFHKLDNDKDKHYKNLLVAWDKNALLTSVSTMDR